MIICQFVLFVVMSSSPNKSENEDVVSSTAYYGVGAKYLEQSAKLVFCFVVELACLHITVI